MVVGQGRDGRVAGLPFDVERDEHQRQLERDGQQRDDQGDQGRARGLRLARAEVEHLVDRAPEDADRGGDDERADDHGRDALQLAVAEGVFVIRGLARQLHEDAHDDIVDDVRGRVDAVGQQRGAAADDADGRLERGQPDVRPQPQVDRAQAQDPAAAGVERLIRSLHAPAPALAGL